MPNRHTHLQMAQLFAPMRNQLRLLGVVLDDVEAGHWGATQSGCMFQDGVKNWLCIVARVVDNAKNFGRRSDFRALKRQFCFKSMELLFICLLRRNRL